MTARPARAHFTVVDLAGMRPLAAPIVGIFVPLMSPPHRCHELTGNRIGRITRDLDHPCCLIIKPNHDALPMRAEGGLDWKAVTAIVIVEIKDTHG